MLSFCVFDRSFWGKGIASKAVALFLKEIHVKYEILTIGAFTFDADPASQKVLEKNGFQLLEAFVEDGKASKYYQLSF